MCWEEKGWAERGLRHSVWADDGTVGVRRSEGVIPVGVTEDRG